MQGQSKKPCVLCKDFAGITDSAARVIMGFYHVFQALQAGAALGLVAVDIGYGGAAICIG